MTALDKMKEIAALLKRGGIEDPAREAEMLITGILHISRTELYAGDISVREDVSRHITDIAVRRTMGEPIQYLIGQVLFYGLTLYVGKGVLIPRPETELLVDETIQQIGLRASPLTILDLCTGSGCIALALARHLTEAIVYGVDSSEAAMVYATQNALANDIRNVRFKLGDLFGPVGSLRFDCIVSNPPYVRHDEIETLQVEIREHEPVQALDGGRDGLDFYRKIFRDAAPHLVGNGIIILEMGFGQAAAIREIAMRSGFTGVNVIKDFAGIERIIAAER
ncbi:MAG: peptide chain release factor N(5)-glutamine methyltransferase [Nitrospirae bacterium]|nr:peptide chain release factor N(5)-glutamine methyltransferase [Nitrospirota bacterium]